jgi:hypothetical protein
LSKPVWDNRGTTFFTFITTLENSAAVPAQVLAHIFWFHLRQRLKRIPVGDDMTTRDFVSWQICHQLDEPPCAKPRFRAAYSTARFPDLFPKPNQLHQREASGWWGGRVGTVDLPCLHGFMPPVLDLVGARSEQIGMAPERQ